MQFFNLVFLGNVSKLLQEAFQIASEKERKTLERNKGRKDSDIENGQQEDQENYEPFMHKHTLTGTSQG